MNFMMTWILHALLQVPIALAITGNGTNVTSIIFPNPLGSCTASTGSTSTPVMCVLDKVIDVIFTFSIPITSGMVIFAGFQMVTAAGDSEKFGKGRKTLQYAAIGFGVVVLAKGVVPILMSILA